MLNPWKFPILLCSLHGTPGDIAGIRYHVEIIEGPVDKLKLHLDSLFTAVVRSEGLPSSSLQLHPLPPLALHLLCYLLTVLEVLPYVKCLSKEPTK